MNRLLMMVLLAAWVTSAQQPPVSNADLRQASAASGLEAAIRSAVSDATSVWVGYAVPKIPGEQESCCWTDGDRGCGLEGHRRVTAGGNPGPVLLEGPTHAVILMRFEAGMPQKLRVFSPDCPLDAGGLRFVWISGVKPAESVGYLTPWATAGRQGGERRSLADAAVHAIAMHAGPAAEAALKRFVEPSRPESVRKKALFWLAHSRGRAGYEAVSRTLREDPSERVREHALFALTQSRDPDALPTLVTAAKQDRTPRIRSKALVWLSQQASKQVADTISEAVDQDPDTQVKKQAVFALSRLPGDEGIPRLIQVARTHTNPAVRKQAIFWLGQSKDARALEFFEQMLLR